MSRFDIHVFRWRWLSDVEKLSVSLVDLRTLA
jgi:hypothetical protein